MSTDSKHTPEPWSYHTEGRRAFLLEKDGSTIAEISKPGLNDALWPA